MRIISATKVQSKFLNESNQQWENYWCWIVTTDTGHIFESTKKMFKTTVKNEATGEDVHDWNTKTEWRQVLLPPLPRPVR